MFPNGVEDRYLLIEIKRRGGDGRWEVGLKERKVKALQDKIELHSLQNNYNVLMSSYKF